MLKLRSRVVCAHWLAAATVVAGLGVACSDAPEPPPPVTVPATAAPAPPPASTPPPTTASPVVTPPPAVAQKPTPPAETVLAKNADVVIKDIESIQPVAVRVGQTVGILSTNNANTWQVDADPDLLKLLSPANQMSKPGDHGWVWRAVKPGTAEIVLIAQAPCPKPPCGENPARFTVTLQISRD